MIELVAILVLVALVGAGAAFKWALPKRLRLFTFGAGGNYVRFFPNLGVTIGSFHWCRHRGRGVH